MKNIKIVVLQRGWIVVGNVTHEGDEVVVSESSVVRRWGTTRGIGEIAINGPTTSTILDPVGTVRAHKLAVVLTIDCEPEKWTNHL